MLNATTPANVPSLDRHEFSQKAREDDGGEEHARRLSESLVRLPPLLVREFVLCPLLHLRAPFAYTGHDVLCCVVLFSVSVFVRVGMSKSVYSCAKRER